MWKQFYAGMPWTPLALLAMGFFVVAFVLVLLRTFVWKSRRDYDAIAALPLEDQGAVWPGTPRGHGEVNR